MNHACELLLLLLIIVIIIIIFSSPNILLSSALCRSGFCTARRLRSSLAQTMNAFIGRLIRGSGALFTGVRCGPCPSGTSPSPEGHSKDSGHDEYALMRAAICALRSKLKDALLLRCRGRAGSLSLKERCRLINKLKRK